MSEIVFRANSETKFRKCLNCDRQIEENELALYVDVGEGFRFGHVCKHCLWSFAKYIWPQGEPEVKPAPAFDRTEKERVKKALHYACGQMQKMAAKDPELGCPTNNCPEVFCEINDGLCALAGAPSPAPAPFIFPEASTLTIESDEPLHGLTIHFARRGPGHDGN